MMNEADLQRLAQILQERGEGLAAINSGEAQLLKALGGAGEALPGTQGMGPAGGPIRSYAKGRGGPGDKPSSGSQSQSTQSRGGLESSKSEKKERTSIDKQFERDPKQRVQDMMDEQEKQRQRDNDTPPPPPPPPKYYDKLGNEYNSAAARDAANAAIDAERATLATSFNNLTTDANFSLLKTNNQLPSFTYLPESEIETAFNNAKAVAVNEAREQIPLYVEALNNTIRANPENGAQQIIQTIGDEGYSRLSNATRLAMYESARYAFDREEAFTLTPGEVEEFARQSVEAVPVADAAAQTIAQTAEATAPTTAAVDTPDQVTVDQITAINIGDITAVEDFDQLAQKINDRLDGKTASVAEQQLAQTTERNLKQLLSLEAGNDIDPAKLRQLRQIYADTQQAAVGQGAILRSQEAQQAEQALIEVLRTKGTIQAQVELANLETRRQTAFKNADLEQARQLSIQSTNLARVIADATASTNVEIANLNARKKEALEQGKLDLATALANLEKDTILARTNATLALQSRALDDTLALANFSSQQALYGLITKVDLAELQASLTEMGFEVQRDLAELDAETQRYVAELTRQWRMSQADTARQGALLELIGTAITGYATIAAASSDYRMKREIRAADSQVEGFLDALNAYQYEYKDPHAPGSDPGIFVGVMAQDLEKTPMGASFVKDTPQGKMVDYGHGLAAILASQSNIHDRLRRLEEG